MSEKKIAEVFNSPYRIRAGGPYISALISGSYFHVKIYSLLSWTGHGRLLRAWKLIPRSMKFVKVYFFTSSGQSPKKVTAIVLVSGET